MVMTHILLKVMTHKTNYITYNIQHFSIDNVTHKIRRQLKISKEYKKLT